MAVYRCPRCDQLVKKDAKQCNRCGLFFDVNNEPVADEGIELSEDEKRKLIVFLIVAGIVILALFVVYFINKNAELRIYGLK